jgi:uncharacterized protein
MSLKMIDLVAQRRDSLQDLCWRHQVRTLELFGSGANGAFDLESSDLDFLVEFQPVEPREQARAYFGLLLALEDLFHRKIDLVEVGAVHNPYFLKSVNENRTLLYAA